MKRFISLIIVAVFVFNTSFIKITNAADSPFKDVSKNIEEIKFLTDRGIINGYSDGTFRPQQTLTRAQAVLMIIREKGITDFSNIPDPGFRDVPKKHSAYNQIAAAVNLGIISGFNHKTYKEFRPGEQLTRAQMAKIMSEAYSLKSDKSADFLDVTKGHWSEKYIDGLFYNNITKGYSGHLFKPNEPIQRQHFSLFMARHLNDDFKDKTPPVKPEPKKEMKVHFIDVGQGDSTLIQTPDGANILIDAGTASSGQKIVSFLKSKDVGKLDLVIATHPHADHIGGMVTVLNAFKVNKFVDSGRVHTTETYKKMLQTIDNKNIPFELATVGKVYNFDNGFNLKVLDVDKNAKNINDASVSVKGTYKNNTVLLTGDAEAAAEARMVARGGLKSTIFKAGHHGSNTSNGVSFLNQVKPAHTVLSYGKGNSYKHPHSQVVNRLKAVGSKIYSTEQSGNITFTMDGDNVKVSAAPFVGKGNDGSGVVEEDKPAPKPEPSKPTTPPKENPGDGTYVIPGAPTSFQNCTAMREYYPNGVKKGHPAYASKHDRDKDGWACEL